MAKVLWGATGRAFVVAAAALAVCAPSVQAQQPPMSTQDVVRQVDPSLIAYLDNVALADQSLQFAVWTQRIAPAQAPALLRDRAAQLAGLDLRGLDSSVVAEHRAAMTQLMQQIEVAIAGSNHWPPERTPGEYRAIAQRTLQQLRADYDQKLARGIAPTATAPALLVVFAWTRGEAQPAMADWIAGEQQRIDDATEGVLTGAATSAATARPGSTPPSSTTTGSPPQRQTTGAPGAAAVSPPTPSPTQAAMTPATPTPSTPGGRVVTIADPTMRGQHIDRCLHWGQQCDEPAATAWCRTQGYQRATTWQWRNMRPTLVMGDNVVCDADYCGAFTTITCTDNPAGSGTVATQAQPATPTPGAASSARPPTPQPGTAPGVPIHNNPGFGSWQLGMDIINGADYRNFAPPNSDPAVCLAECARDTRCRAVTYTMPGTNGAAQGMCWLKGQTGSFRSHPSAISAVKMAATTPAATPPSSATPPPIPRDASSPGIPPVVKSPLAQCDIGGQWRMDTRNVGQSTWTFSPLGGDRYSAQEAGLGNASGTASVNGNSLRLEWSAGGYSGVVELTLDARCSSGQGRQVFYTGRTGSEASTWTRIGAASPVAKPPPVAAPPVAAAPGGLTGQWHGPAGIYEMTQTGNNFTWRVGNEIGQGTITGDDLQVTWTGGGFATGKITRNPQGLPIAIAWSNTVVFKRVGY